MARPLLPLLLAGSAAALAPAAAGQQEDATGLLFEPPVFINQGEWGTGEFHTLDAKRGVVVGRDRSGWATSTDGGETRPHPQRPAASGQPIRRGQRPAYPDIPLAAAFVCE